MSEVIKCQCYTDKGKCEKPATVKIERANTYACDECYLAAILRLGCALTTTPVKQDYDKGDV